MRLKHFLLALVLGCLIGAAPVFAQIELAELYVAPDDSFEFLYPSDWEVDDGNFEDSGFVFLSGEVGRDFISMSFLSPSFVDSLDPRARDLEDVADALGEIFELDNADLIEFEDREMLLADISIEESVGIILVVEFDDSGFGAALAFGEDADSFEDDDLLEAVIAVSFSFNTVGTNEDFGGSTGGNTDDRDNNSSSSGFPDELSDFDAAWQDAVAELEDEGVIASGGSLIFNENSAFFDGIGSWFTPLARRTLRRDIVMAAELAFTSDSNEFESCSIMARIEDSGTSVVNTYIEVGITNDGEAFWVDSDGDDFNSDVVDLNLDLDDPHHIMLIAQVDRLNIYVDGELAFADVRVNERNGYFGIALLGQGAGSRCEGSNVWAYDAPAFVEGLCEAVAGGTVNKRSGPGTEFDRAGTMAGGERLEVVGQAEDTAGFIWYELEDDSWVREDVVSIQGDCGDIPESD